MDPRDATGATDAACASADPSPPAGAAPTPPTADPAPPPPPAAPAHPRAGAADGPRPAGTVEARQPAGTEERQPADTVEEQQPAGTVDEQRPVGTVQGRQPAGTADRQRPADTATPPPPADEPARTAHQDTFARDHLPPREQWPKLLFGLPELRYPERLNAAVELLARTAPERPAFRTPDGGTWTYGRLRTQIDRIAHALTSHLGVVPGNRVLLRGPTTPWLAACWLAVLKAGAVAVTVLAQQRPHELRTICEIARVGHALCDVRAVDDLARAGVAGLRITPYGGDSPGDLLRLPSPEEPYPAVDTAAEDVALIAFTSGTTGRPKGCVHFHRDLLAVADTFSRHVLEPRPDDVFAGSPPLGFTFGLGGLVVFPLRAGASALLLEQAGPRQLLPAIAEYRVSVLFTAPTAYRTMLNELDGYDITSLRRCVSAGENLSATTWRAWHRRTGLRIINGIGATELLHIFISAADDRIRPGTTGVPVPGWQARVQDADGTPLPDGEPGLLAVRGPVGCRYLADPRQREYVRDGWNITGDTYVREPDGWFRFVARADDMIVSAGYNIAGPEVEDALLRHPDVLETAVVGRPDEARGQIAVAYTVLRAGAPRDPEALRAFLTSELVPFKCPREFVFVDALPRTATGKLQRFRLRTHHAGDGHPDDGTGLCLEVDSVSAESDHD